MEYYQNGSNLAPTSRKEIPVPSDVYFNQAYATPLQVQDLGSKGYVALRAIILVRGTPRVDPNAEVVDKSDAEHPVAIRRDSDGYTITLTQSELATISESDAEPAKDAYVQAQINNSGWK